MRVDHMKLKVGTLVAFVVITLLTFLYLFQMAGGRLRLDSPYSAKAMVPEALNIVKDADVRRDGIKIGRVRQIEPVGTDSKLSFEIEKKDQAQLYKDATIRVRTKTLVGESYLDIEPGHPSSGKLPSGSTLPLTAAKEVVPLERILSTMDPATRREVRRNLDGFGTGLEGHGGDLNRLFGAAQPAVADTGKLMRVLKAQRAELAQLIGNTGVVTGALGERTAAFRTLAVTAKQTAQTVVARDDKLKESLGELPATLDRAQSSVHTLVSFSRSATPVVRDLKLSARDLAPTVRDLGPVARSTRELFRQLGPFLTKFDPLLTQLTPASNNLRGAVGPLDAFLRQANPFLGYLKPYSKEIGTWFGSVGSAVGFKDAYGYKGRVFAMVSPEDYTNFTADQKRLLGALMGALPAGGLKPQSNVFPKPGDPGQERPFDGGYTRVQASK